MICPKCGHKKIFDFTICPKCGYNINEAFNKQQQELRNNSIVHNEVKIENENENKIKDPFKILSRIFIVLALIVLIISHYIILGNAQNKLEDFNNLNPTFLNYSYILLDAGGGIYKLYNGNSGEVVNDCVIRFTKSEEIWEAKNGIAKCISGGFITNIIPIPLAIAIVFILFAIIINKYKWLSKNFFNN